MFYGPTRFVAILNRKITLIDEDDSFATYSKLVSINDMNGTGWETYGRYNNTVGLDILNFILALNSKIISILFIF